MCRDEAYARPAIGRLDEIKALTPESVTAAWRRLLARAPADLFLAGDLSWAAAQRFAKKLGLHKGRRPARLKATRRVKAGRVRTVRERAEVGQAKLEMGFRNPVRIGSAGVPASMLMNALFGGSPVSRLFKEVREKASLCYSIHSVAERTKGLILVHAGIDETNYARARRLILKQLRALQEGDIPAPEFEMARGILLSSMRGMRDSPTALMNFALERAVNGVPADLDGLMADLAVVKPADVARAARKVTLDTVFLLRS
jgi:predicted Zn-dependent peptidase